MSLRELAEVAIERLKASPFRSILWVVIGQQGVPVWDLLEPGQTPGRSSLWTMIGPISAQQSVEEIVAILSTAARSGSET